MAPPPPRNSSWRAASDTEVSLDTSWTAAHGPQTPTGHLRPGLSRLDSISDRTTPPNAVVAICGVSRTERRRGRRLVGVRAARV